MCCSDKGFEALTKGPKYDRSSFRGAARSDTLVTITVPSYVGGQTSRIRTYRGGPANTTRDTDLAAALRSVIHTTHTHVARRRRRYAAYARTRTRTTDIRTYIPSRDDTYIHITRAITDAHAPIASHALQHSRQRGHRLCRSRPARHTLARRRGKQGTGVWMQVPPPPVARARYVPQTAGGRVVDLVGVG